MPTGPYLDGIDLIGVAEEYKPDEVNEQETYVTTSGAPVVVKAPDVKRKFALKVGPYTLAEGATLKTSLYKSSFSFYPKGETTPLTCCKISEGVQEDAISGGFSLYYSFTIQEL